jgi:hypothetical protein
MLFRISAIILKKSTFTFFVLQGRAMAQIVSRRLPARRPGFNLEPVRVGFVVAKVTRSWVSLRVLQFTPLRIIPLMLHT